MRAASLHLSTLVAQQGAKCRTGRSASTAGDDRSLAKALSVFVRTFYGSAPQSPTELPDGTGIAISHGSPPKRAVSQHRKIKRASGRCAPRNQPVVDGVLTKHPSAYLPENHCGTSDSPAALEGTWTPRIRARLQDNPPQPLNTQMSPGPAAALGGVARPSLRNCNPSPARNEAPRAVRTRASHLGRDTATSPRTTS
jgi:hypothetical protein